MSLWATFATCIRRVSLEMVDPGEGGRYSPDHMVDGA